MTMTTIRMNCTLTDIVMQFIPIHLCTSSKYFRYDWFTDNQRESRPYFAIYKGSCNISANPMRDMIKILRPLHIHINQNENSDTFAVDTDNNKISKTL